MAPLHLVAWILVVLLALASTALALRCRRQSCQLRSGREQLPAIADRLEVGIACIDHDGRYLYVNPCYAGWIGGRVDALLNRHIEQVGDGNLALQLRARLAGLANGETLSFEHDLVRPDGDQVRRVRFDLLHYHLEQLSAAPQTIVVVTDLTAGSEASERMRRQLAELAHVARLSTMGELAAKLAHELNQPLCAISGYTQASLRMMRAGQWDEEELVEALEDASQQAERAADIIRGMRNFLRKSTASRAIVDLVELIHEVVPLVQPEARQRGVSLRLELPDRLPRVHADRTELDQVIFNLLMNAVESFDSTATATKSVTLSAGQTATGGIEVAVSDNGSGFVEGVAEHLFDQFFSTKQHGMGMGLSICRTIIEAHGGELQAHNNDRGGATFVFQLPGV